MEARSTVQARVTRRFNGAPERVFDAWLDPDRVRKWMFSNDEILHIEIDPRVGGVFSFLVRRGEEEIDHVGEYLEIERPRRLAFTWGVAGEEGSDGVTVELAPLGSGCELTLTHALHPDWSEYAERTEAAWAQMLDLLAATLT